MPHITSRENEFFQSLLPSWFLEFGHRTGFLEWLRNWNQGPCPARNGQQREQSAAGPSPCRQVLQMRCLSPVQFQKHCLPVQNIQGDGEKRWWTRPTGLSGAWGPVGVNRQHGGGSVCRGPGSSQDAHWTSTSYSYHPDAIVEKGFIYLSPKLSHLEDSNDNTCPANCLRSSQGPQKMVGDEVLGTVKAGGGVGHWPQHAGHAGRRHRWRGAQPGGSLCAGSVQEKHLGWEHKGRHREVCAPSAGSDVPFLMIEIE